MYRAGLDTCALVPGLQRDFLLQLAAEHAYAPLWGSGILFELDYVLERIHKKCGVTDSAQRRTHLFERMGAVFPGALVVAPPKTGTYDYDLLDADDGNVVHAAIMGKADAIVTDDVRAGFHDSKTLAAALIDFEDDPDVVASLTQYALTEPNYFPVAVQRAHDDRARAAKRTEVQAAETAKGHRILDERPGWNKTPYALRDLATADGRQVSAETVQGKDGIAVYVAVYGRENVTVEHYVDDPGTSARTVGEGLA